VSMITTPTKSRVTKPRGIKLAPMDDGTALAHDERRCTPTPLWAKGTILAVPNKQALATEVADVDPERALYIPAAAKAAKKREWVITVDGEGLVVHANQRPTVRAASSKKSGQKIPDSQVDSVIRKTGYTGPIDKRMRAMARDVISHRASLAHYEAGA
jgi:hypothetical protein